MMEVHAHTHTAQKKFIHYFWEFFMLFAAVFCGFLAENIRENQVERHREKEFIHSIVEDIQKDTANLSTGIARFIENERLIDTILKVYKDITKGINATFYSSLLPLYGYKNFIYTDRTIQQLKSSGGMRLIQNKKAANGIMDYDSYIRNFQIDAALVERFLENIFQERDNILDQQALEADIKTKTINEILKSGKNYLIVSDPVTLARFRNRISTLQLIYSTLRKQEIKMKQAGTELIELLRKEYRFK